MFLSVLNGNQFGKSKKQMYRRTCFCKQLPHARIYSKYIRTHNIIYILCIAREKDLRCVLKNNLLTIETELEL